MTPTTTEATQPSSNLIIIPLPREAENRSVLDKARQIVIKTPEEYVTACEAKLAIDEMIRGRHLIHDPVCHLADQTHKAATRARAADLGPLEEAKTIYTRAIDGWQREQRRIEQERAEAAQREQERIALEAREREIEEAEAAAATGSPEQKQEAIQEVQALIERPIYVPPVQVARQPAAVPKVAGIRKRPENWKAKLDPATTGAKLKLIKFIAVNPQFEHLLEVNQTSANALGKALKTTMQIPGLIAYDENA